LHRALDQLSRIVVTLGADAGFWLGPSGEKVRMIDATGRIYQNRETLSLLVAMICRNRSGGSVVVPAAATQAVDDLARAAGIVVQRTRSDGRSLTEAGRDRQVRMVASLDDRYGWPAFQPHFDGLFTIAKTMELCARTGLSLAQAFALAPRYTYHHLQLACSWELKGGLMRRMSEDAVDREASFVDGVRIAAEGGWVLLLPDQHRPVAHIYIEAADPLSADRLRDIYRGKVSGWLEEMARA
jgi:mannose-1-phosphate guanylyltransferase/phosphomannomutase